MTKLLVAGASIGVGAAVSQALLVEALNPGVEVKLARQQGKTAAVETVMPNDGMPDRLSINPQSRFFTSCGQYVGVRLNGEDVNGRVIEFCRSGGWVRIANVEPGQKVNRRQVEEAPKHHGVVELYWRMTPSRQVRRQLARIK